MLSQERELARDLEQLARELEQLSRDLKLITRWMDHVGCELARMPMLTSVSVYRQAARLDNRRNPNPMRCSGRPALRQH